MNGTTTGPKWAVYDSQRFWLSDTCAGGAWSESVEDAVWFDSQTEAITALAAANIEAPDWVPTDRQTFAARQTTWTVINQLTVCRVR